MAISDRPQADPTPPNPFGAPEPSLTVYGVLVGLALLMVVAAFLIAPADWAGLSLNLATEIIGAVVLLIVVDRRIRRSDIRFIHRISQRARVKFIYAVFPEVRAVARYAEALNASLEEIRPPSFFRRESMSRLEELHPNGFVLKGGPMMGKSVILQDIALRFAKDLLADPAKSRIPVIVPMRLWTQDSVLRTLIDIVRSYSFLRERSIRRFLQEGRFVLLFDGVDEVGVVRGRGAVDKAIEEIRRHIPKVFTIVSGRTGFDFDVAGLPTVVIPPLTADEREELAGLYGRR